MIQIQEFLPLRDGGNCENFSGSVALSDFCVLRVRMLLVTCAKKIVFSPAFVCLFVNRITKNIFKRFSQNSTKKPL